MLFELDAAVAVAKGMGLLSASMVPHEGSSGQCSAGHVLRSAGGEVLCEVPPGDLRGWELVNPVPRSIDPQGPGKSSSLLFMRR